MRDTGHILAFMAHPDDVEFLCAGTLVRLREKGYRIHIATMTAGDCGSMDLPPEQISQLRINEARTSANMLDATFQYLGEKDGLICYQPETICNTVETLRVSQAFLVITHSPSDYMIDHEVTAQLVRNAAFCAGIPNFKTGAIPPAPHLEGVPYLYYAMPLEGKDCLGHQVEMDFQVDISRQLETKTAMLKCHASQRDWLMKHHGVDEYVAQMKRWAAAAAKPLAVAYAEGFRQHRGHAYPQDNILVELLGATEANLESGN
jgi:LmbE family N-acetylglucosaminyl deacetylase